jgi:hypothetical protein
MIAACSVDHHAWFFLCKDTVEDQMIARVAGQGAGGHGCPQFAFFLNVLPIIPAILLMQLIYTCDIDPTAFAKT